MHNIYEKRIVCQVGYIQEYVPPLIRYMRVFSAHKLLCVWNLPKKIQMLIPIDCSWITTFCGRMWIRHAESCVLSAKYETEQLGWNVDNSVLYLEVHKFYHHLETDYTDWESLCSSSVMVQLPV